MYRGWGPRLLHQLLCTLEPNKSKMWKQLTKQQCQECLEFALDIRFFGDTLDRIGCENQKQLFQQLLDPTMADSDVPQFAVPFPGCDG